MATLSYTNSFRLPLKERPAVVQRSEIIRSRKYNVGKHIGEQDDVDNFNALCRGEQLVVVILTVFFSSLARMCFHNVTYIIGAHLNWNVKSDRIMAQLKCWYDSRRQPYLLLMPVRVEQHSIEPAIYTFHNVISDSEIETIKELAKPMVKGRHFLLSGSDEANF